MRKRNTQQGTIDGYLREVIAEVCASHTGAPKATILTCINDAVGKAAAGGDALAMAAERLTDGRKYEHHYDRYLDSFRAPVPTTTRPKASAPAFIGVLRGKSAIQIHFLDALAGEFVMWHDKQIMQTATMQEKVEVLAEIRRLCEKYPPEMPVRDLLAREGFALDAEIRVA